jgi:hypothetical protein
MKHKPQTAVYRGMVQGTGANHKEALADLDRNVDWACGHNHTHVEVRFGRVLIASPTPQGYTSRIVPSNVLTDHGHVVVSVCFYGQMDGEEVMEGLRLHAAQLAWNHEVNDDKHLGLSGLGSDDRREVLRSWIRFQRLYRLHKEAGATPAECHERACRGELPEVAK